MKVVYDAESLFDGKVPIIIGEVFDATSYFSQPGLVKVQIPRIAPPVVKANDYSPPSFSSFEVETREYRDKEFGKIKKAIYCNSKEDAEEVMFIFGGYSKEEKYIRQERKQIFEEFNSRLKIAVEKAKRRIKID